MALTGPQLNAASQALAAAQLTDKNVSASGLNYSDLFALYQTLQGDQATAADLQSFISNAKDYSSTDAWGSMDVDAAIAKAGASSTYTAGALAMAADAQAPSGIAENAGAAWESVKAAPGKAWDGVKKAAVSIGGGLGSFGSSTLSGLKWILWGAAALLVIFLFVQLYPLFKHRD
jgi:hypothetical protein